MNFGPRCTDDSISNEQLKFEDKSVVNIILNRLSSMAVSTFHGINPLPMSIHNSSPIFLKPNAS